MTPDNEKRLDEIRELHKSAFANRGHNMHDDERERAFLVSLLDAETARADEAEKQSKEEHRAALNFRAKAVTAEGQANRYLEAKQRLQVQRDAALAKLQAAEAEVEALREALRGIEKVNCVTGCALLACAALVTAHD